MKIAFLCGLFSDDRREEIERKSKGVIQYAADTLQWSIIRGLDLHINEVSLINLPYIGSFPSRYKDPIFRESLFAHKTGGLDINAGFLNVTLIKLYSRYVSARKQLEKWAKSDTGSKVILIYAVHVPFIKAAIEIRRLHKDIKVCLIVPDLPEYMGGNTSFHYKILRKLQDHLLDGYLPLVDSFVVLTKYMAIPLKIGRRPWICIEGIYGGDAETAIEQKQAGKIVMYSGTLALRYGIMNLLNAFQMINSTSYELWICGEGKGRHEVMKRSANDCRIKYFGQVSKDKVCELQRQATVLVNPRTSQGEYTKYSFPSKLIEYLASGTPAIIHRLPGIPDEYYEYCFVAEREDAIGMSLTIRRVCEMNETELMNIGKRARRFIINEKNAHKQTAKIVHLLENN